MSGVSFNSIVAFRNHQAKQLLPLCSRSYLNQAMQFIKNLPSGGGTPLASGFLKGIRMLLNEKRKGLSHIPVIVLISDGKANVPTSNRISITDEIRIICRKIRNEGIFLVFIDTYMESNKKGQKYTEIRRILQDESSSYHHISDLSF